LANPLNADGAGRVVSVQDPASGQLLIGFEDGRDFDFNDVVVAIEHAAAPLNEIVGTCRGRPSDRHRRARPHRRPQGADELIGAAGDDILKGNPGPTFCAATIRSRSAAAR
jgi:hypothetical protein